MKVVKMKQIVSNGNNQNVYGIKPGEPITLQHLISIKLYTDYTSLCKTFCEAFRLKKLTQHLYERMLSLENRNKKIANWARLLTESVQAYGTIRSSKKVYYRGIDAAFIFKRFVTRFNAPLSTTIDVCPLCFSIMSTFKTVVIGCSFFNIFSLTKQQNLHKKMEMDWCCI